MVANYEIKRNSLSARWGVWSSEQGADAPVENLLAEFKSQDQAETFKERVSSGQPADAVIAEINAKPTAGKSEGGLFGKFFKRGPKPEVTVAPQTSNPVIQIQAVQKSEDEVTSSENEEISLTSSDGAEPVQRTPMIRYEDETPERPEIRVQPEVSAQVEPARLETPSELSAISEPVIESEAAPNVQPQTVSEVTAPQENGANPIDQDALKMVSHMKASVPEAPASKEANVAPVERPEPQAKMDEATRQGMVNWTFTPPPDVSAAEVQSGATPNAPVEKIAPPQPKVDFREVHGTKIAVETARFEALRTDSAGGEEISDKKYNSIASKEYTEVSKAYASRNSQGTLHDELLHLATVCMAWADAIEKRMASGANERAA